MNHIHKILDFIINNKIKFIAGFAVVIALTVAFATGGSLNSTSMPVAATADNAKDITYANETSDYTLTATEAVSAETLNTNTTNSSTSAENNKNIQSNVQQELTETKAASQNNSNNESSNTQNKVVDKYQTESIPQGKPEPVEPEEQVTKDTTLICTISISCSTILDNMSKLDPAKKDLVPSDGWILKPTKVTFNEGESVFDVLKKVCKDNLIHFEFSWTPIYNSAYIEGINNLYEFDCGSTSGWMYCVDNWYPNYGCSRYVIKNGDTIDWKYTCNLGYDINGGYATGEKQQ